MMTSCARDLRTILDIAPTLAPDDPCLASATERLTDYHVQAVEALGRPADLIGFHGQTILHQPHRRRTWQIGDAGTLARRLGVPVAHDFRSADVAAGGQGAPFVPVYHAALAVDLPKPLAILNIGGVANVTWIGRDGALLAFDTGPGNGPLDDWVFRHTGQAFDQDGTLAALRPSGHGRARAAASAFVFRTAGAEVARPAGFRGRRLPTAACPDCPPPTAPRHWRGLPSRRSRPPHSPNRQGAGWSVAEGGLIR